MNTQLLTHGFWLRMRTFGWGALIALLLAISSSPAVAQTPAQMPDTPASRQFAGWLEAFNSGDAEKILRLFEKPGDRETWVKNSLRIQRTSGGFDFTKTLEFTATTFTALLKSRNNDPRIQPYVRAVIEVDAAAPDRVIDIRLSPVPTPAEFLPRRMADTELVEALKAQLTSDARSDKFSGAVLVGKEGKPIFSAAYDFADREHKTPNKVETCFRLGSMNKMFTATAILELVQAGKLQLTDPLGKYLTDYPNKEIASKVTIEQLLTHTGGHWRLFRPGIHSSSPGAKDVAGLREFVWQARPDLRTGK